MDISKRQLTDCPGTWRSPPSEDVSAEIAAAFSYPYDTYSSCPPLDINDFQLADLEAGVEVLDDNVGQGEESTLAAAFTEARLTYN